MPMMAAYIFHSSELLNQKLVAVIAVGLTAVALKVLNILVKYPASVQKRFASFNEFYPYYLTEHSQAWTKRLHLLGTVLMIVQLCISWGLIAAMLVSGLLALAVFPYMRWLRTGIPEFVLLLVTYVYLGHLLTGSWSSTLSLPFGSYFCAWLGHFIVEHNKPATFVYPIFSLMGDIRMAFEMVTGTLPL